MGRSGAAQEQLPNACPTTHPLQLSPGGTILQRILEFPFGRRLGAVCEQKARRIQELEFVNDELSAALGLGGRDRKTSDQAERARLRIGKAIRSALTVIREHDPSLGHHFSACIRTGYYCAYIPDPRQVPAWKV
jgi:hypothetical protein